MEHQFSKKSDRIILVPMSRSDSEAYRVLRNRADNRSFFFTDREITAEEQERWYGKYLADDTQYMFSAYETGTRRFVGGLGISDIDKGKKTAETGRIIIDRKTSGGKGYGAEALRLLSRIAWENLMLESVYANIYASNDASLKTFLNAGYHVIKEGKETVTVRMDLKKE